MFDQLRKDHDRIRIIVADLRHILVEDGVQIGMCFASARWALTRELLRHMAVEAQVLRGRAPPVDSPPPGAEDFEHRYRAHLTRWTATEIDSHWPDYCRDLLGILTALEQRMALEERAIFPRLQ